MIKVTKWLIIVTVVVGLIVLVERLWGSGPAGLFATLIAGYFGVSLGVSWGSKRADETDEYRQKWLSGRRETPEDRDGSPT